MKALARVVVTVTPPCGQVKDNVAAPGAPQANEITVAVRAAAVNPVDHKKLDYNFCIEADAIQGVDYAGVVTAVGEGVTRFAVGDRVAGMSAGSFCESGNFPVSTAVKIPDSLSYEEVRLSSRSKCRSDFVRRFSCKFALTFTLRCCVLGCNSAARAPHRGAPLSRCRRRASAGRRRGRHSAPHLGWLL